MKVIWGWTLFVKWVNHLVEQEFKKAQKVVGRIVVFFFLTVLNELLVQCLL
jgi:hypothetical protein